MTETGTEVVLSQKVVAQFASMVTALEEFDTSGMDGMLSDIFAANTAEDYNKIFEGEREMPLGTPLRVDRVRYAQSDFVGGLSFYAVIDGLNIETGELGQWTTGATVVVATLVRAAFAGHLPCIGSAYQADATKSGFRPINWNMRQIKVDPELPIDLSHRKAK